MTYFVLDVDQTILVSGRGKKFIHEEQNLGRDLVVPLLESNVIINIINPQDFSNVLNKAEYEGIFILTSGFWDSRAILLVAEELEKNFGLTSDAATKLKEAPIFAPWTETGLYINFLHYLKFTFEPDMLNQIVTIIKDTAKAVQMMPKQERLEKIIQCLKLTQKEFVILDDNAFHIDSFDGIAKITAIKATTYSANREFYSEVIDALKRCTEKEQSENNTFSKNECRALEHNIATFLKQTISFTSTFFRAHSQLCISSNPTANTSKTSATVYR